MGKRMLALLLTFCLLAGLMPAVHAADTEKQVVVYIPLDNRPFNDSQVRTMAESLNMELVMPPEDLYATKLDDQELNENGTQCGNREALLTWLQAQAETYDTFVISLDQLLSGGLMSSRCMEEFESLVFDDGSTMTEYEVIDYLRELSRNHTVYIIDSVMRLATSVNYDSYNLTHYELFRRYGAVSRPVLTGSRLNVDTIIRNYPLYVNGSSLAYYYAGFTSDELSILLSPKAASAGLVTSQALMDAYLEREDPAAGYEEVYSSVTASESDGSLLSSYLSTRARKLRLTSYAIEELCGSGNVCYLLGVDDSAEGNTIQTNEIALFESLLSGHNGQIFSALDGLGQTALSTIFLKEHSGAISASVTYFGDEVDDVQTFNCYTVRDMMSQTLRYFGCTTVKEDPDVAVVAVTSTDTNPDILLCQLVSLLNENEADQIPTILVDLTGNRLDGLNDMLLENTHMGMLLSYSGSAELPNSILMALSQGLARYRALTLSDFQTDATQTAHLQSLASALVREMGYSDSARTGMSKYLTALGLDQDNFGALDADTIQRIHTELTEQVSDASRAVLENLADSGFITSLGSYATGSISSVSVTRCAFPWLRQMEIDCDVSVSWSGTPADTGTFHRAYVIGVSATSFEPDRDITRQEAAKMLVSIVGLTVDLSDTASPSDVTQWARPYVNAALNKGYLRGYPDGSFRGENSITRAEFAAMLHQYAQAEKLALPSIKSISFTDVSAGDDLWYVPSVYALAAAGVIYGDPGGTFRPEDPITRAEAVTMLNRMFHRGEDQAEPLSASLREQLRFTDVTALWHIVQIQEASISHFSN